MSSWILSRTGPTQFNCRLTFERRVRKRGDIATTYGDTTVAVIRQAHAIPDVLRPRLFRQ